MSAKIRDLLKSNQAFVNPYGETIQTTKNAINNLDPDTMVTKINRVCDKLNIPQISESDLSELHGSLTNLSNTCDSFQRHTDELSGVVFDGVKNIASVIEITHAAQDTAAECGIGDKPSNNNPFTAVMGAIVNQPVIVSALNTVNAHIDAFVAYFDVESYTDILLTKTEQEKIAAIQAKIDELKTQYDAIKGVVDDQKSDDDDAYAESQREVLMKVVADQVGAFVGYNCSNQILNMIKSPKLALEIENLKKLKK